MEFSKFYRELILDHAKNPRNSGSLLNPDLTVKKYNPLCGDELELGITFEKKTIKEIKIKVRGCFLARASSSLMSEFIWGRPVSHAKEVTVLFKQLIEENRGMNTIPGELKELKPLFELKKHRNRAKCMLLPWNALEESLISFPFFNIERRKSA